MTALPLFGCDRELATLTVLSDTARRDGRDGLSNREIGQHRFSSHRTVGSHLSYIFPKLGSPPAPSCAPRWMPASPRL